MHLQIQLTMTEFYILLPCEPAAGVLSSWNCQLQVGQTEAGDFGLQR
jgi:hypothetical protein